MKKLFKTLILFILVITLMTFGITAYADEGNVELDTSESVESADNGAVEVDGFKLWMASPYHMPSSAPAQYSEDEYGIATIATGGCICKEGPTLGKAGTFVSSDSAGHTCWWFCAVCGGTAPTTHKFPHTWGKGYDYKPSGSSSHTFKHDCTVIQCHYTETATESCVREKSNFRSNWVDHTHIASVNDTTGNDPNFDAGLVSTAYPTFHVNMPCTNSNAHTHTYDWKCKHCTNHGTDTEKHNATINEHSHYIHIKYRYEDGVGREQSNTHDYLVTDGYEYCDKCKPGSSATETDPDTSSGSSGGGGGSSSGGGGGTSTPDPNPPHTHNWHYTGYTQIPIYSTIYREFHWHNKRCDGCGSITYDVEPHSHSGYTGYDTHDGSQHIAKWTCSDCGYDGYDLEAHSYSNYGNAISDGSGGHHYMQSCSSCGQTRTGTTTAHSWAHDYWDQGTINSNHVEHMKCSVCGETKTQNNAAHKWVEQSRTDTGASGHNIKYKCSDCGLTKTVLEAHDLYITGYTNYTSSQHYVNQKCRTCTYTTKYLANHTIIDNSPKVSQIAGNTVNHKHNQKCSLCTYTTSFEEKHTDSITGYSTTTGANQKIKHITHHRCTVCGLTWDVLDPHGAPDAQGYCPQCHELLGNNITWHYFEGVPNKTTFQIYTHKLVIPETKGRNGYKFIGWFDDPGEGKQWTADDTYNVGDPAEMWAQYAIVVEVHIDQTAPTITVVRDPSSPETPTKQVTLRIHVDPNDEHPSATPVMVESYTDWSPNDLVFTVTENGTYKIISRDELGNTREYTVYVENIDKSAPVINSMASNTEAWTNKPVTVTVDATDDVKLNVTAYSWTLQPNDGSAAITSNGWTASNSFQVAKPGVLTVKVRDALGNETTSAPYYVNNVDVTAPSAEYSLSVSNSEKVAAETGVTITVHPIDNEDPSTGMSSGLANNPIKWSGTGMTSSYGRSTAQTVHENGTYTVWVKDAVGNESVPVQINITSIISASPVVSLTEKPNPVDGSTPTKLPLTLHADVDWNGLDPNPDGWISWDGGHTWGTYEDHVVTDNGEYTVMVRDSTGTITTSRKTYTGGDGVAPIVSMVLSKGAPADMPDATEANYVWKLTISANDGVLGSGVDVMTTQWNGQSYTSSDPQWDINLVDGTVGKVFELETAGTYSVTVTDKVGNSTTSDKTLTWTDLGESPDGPSQETSITKPALDGSEPWGHGSAGSPYDANLEDLVFGPTGAYNTKTGEFTPYPDGLEGIPVHFNAEVTRNKWATAKVTYDGNVFNAVWNYTGAGTGTEKVRGDGTTQHGYAFIPASYITKDYKNARIKIEVFEWDDEACTQLHRQGSQNFYTSTSVSKPEITYAYDIATRTLTFSASSNVVGIKNPGGKLYSLNGGAFVEYTGPFVVPEGTTTINLKAIDNLGQEATKDLDVATMGLNGGTNGVGSIPSAQKTDENAGTSSYHSSNRSADIYIIGGTRGNTDSVPDGSVFSALTGNTLAPIDADADDD